MNETNTGGPAFPVSIPGWGDNGAHGMTLRDYFAAKAMAAMLGDSTSKSSAPDFISEWAYKHADSMLKAREA